jgi:UDP-glucuronate 4-epimerase
LKILVTGAAGFIGYFTAKRLLERGDTVVGFDNFNSYYDPRLKRARAKQLSGFEAFRMVEGNLEDREVVSSTFGEHKFDKVVHLAAQAGVRYSIENPHAYIDSNITGTLHILEGCRHTKVKHLVYASSSSVYGANTGMPFSVHDSVNHPLALYGATKKANEMMAHAYSSLYNIPTTGLRFFTVYGPWGRPDMAAYIYARAIAQGEPIQLFNNGDMKRDFTYVGDIVSGILGCLGKPPVDYGTSAPHNVYNLGNHKSEPLKRFVEIIEHEIGKKAIVEYAPMQPGDVKETYADISASERDFGYKPTTSIDEGLPRFVAWFRDYHGIG